MRIFRVEEISRITRATVILTVVGFGMSACISASDVGFGKGTKTKFSSSEYGVAASPRLTHAKKTKKGGGRYSLGKPYKVRGKWYTPKHQPNYDKVGTSSWYGPNFHGRQTANGEIYDMHMPSAAHTTLPLPSYVRVTNLANGRHMVVRVNDRGPYVHGRVIDLSMRAAEMLDFKNKGVAKVRVQYLGRAPLNGDDTAYLVATLNRKQKEGLPSTSLVNMAMGLLADRKSVAVARTPKPVLKPTSGKFSIASELQPSIKATPEGEFTFDGGRFGAGFSYADSQATNLTTFVSNAHNAIDQALTNNSDLAAWSVQNNGNSSAADAGDGAARQQVASVQSAVDEAERFAAQKQRADAIQYRLAVSEKRVLREKQQAASLLALQNSFVTSTEPTVGEAIALPKLPPIQQTLEDAFAATEQVATRDNAAIHDFQPQLSEPAAQGSTAVSIVLGTFSVRENAEKLGKKFARLAAVDLDLIVRGGKTLTLVKVSRLKPGVSRNDIYVLARQNGLALKK